MKNAYSITRKIFAIAIFSMLVACGQGNRLKITALSQDRWLVEATAMTPMGIKGQRALPYIFIIPAAAPVSMSENIAVIHVPGNNHEWIKGFVLFRINDRYDNFEIHLLEKTNGHVYGALINGVYTVKMAEILLNPDFYDGNLRMPPNKRINQSP